MHILYLHNIKFLILSLFQQTDYKVFWGLVFFPFFSTGMVQFMVGAGGSHHKLLQLCVWCISTPPHCLTQLLSFIYCLRGSSPCTLTALRHYSTTSSIIPHRPGLIHLCSPHTHTQHRSPQWAAAVLHEQKCVSTAAALMMPWNTSLFFARRVVPVWICMNLLWGCSCCSGANMITW